MVWHRLGLGSILLWSYWNSLWTHIMTYCRVSLNTMRPIRRYSLFWVWEGVNIWMYIRLVLFGVLDCCWWCKHTLPRQARVDNYKYLRRSHYYVIRQFLCLSAHFSWRLLPSGDVIRRLRKINNKLIFFANN